MSTYNNHLFCLRQQVGSLNRLYRPSPQERGALLFSESGKENASALNIVLTVRPNQAKSKAVGSDVLSAAYRVQINDVNIRLKMLLNNEMDAVLLSEPQATRARLEGHVKLMDSRDKNVRLGVFAFRTEALKEPRRKQQLDLFIKAYNMAVDSINKNGVQHYKDLIIKNCGVDARTVDALPKLRYQHAGSPRKHDRNIANSIKN